MALIQEHPGFLSLLSSLKQIKLQVRNQPIDQLLSKWDSKVNNGHIKRLIDQDIDLPVIQIIGTNIMRNSLSYPQQSITSMKVKFPILVILAKNLDKYFRFQISILDNKGVKRTFIASNKQSITRIKPFQCSMPLQLDPAWNQICFDLDDFCQKAFGTHFVQCLSISINANTRIARIYFNDVIKSQQQIPADYKLFMRVVNYKS